MILSFFFWRRIPNLAFLSIGLLCIFLRRKHQSGISLTLNACSQAQRRLGVVCALRFLHKPCQRIYKVEAFVRLLVCTHQGHRLQNLKDIVYTLNYAFFKEKAYALEEYNDHGREILLYQ